ncbi:hypothetical protein, partial [Staphylococcus aureus]
MASQGPKQSKKSVYNDQAKLFQAAEDRDFDTLKSLFKTGDIDVLAVDQKNRTALELACRKKLLGKKLT